MIKDKFFIPFTIATSSFLFVFVFWLGFPGYFQEGDIYNSLALNTDHWHPVIIARFLQSLYFLFGKHSFYLFLLNIFCFYAGASFFIIALYMKTKNPIWYALFSVTAIGNIFFHNFIEYHSFTFPMLIWLGSSMVFFQLLVKVKRKYYSFCFNMFTFIVFFLALLWRHNGILSVYPFFVFFVYQYLNRKNDRKENVSLFKFFNLMILIGFILATVVKIHPYLFSNNVNETKANHIFLHQIAGMVVPANDQTFIPKGWYEEGKSFQDVKKMYKRYPTVADPFNVPWEPYNSDRPFKRTDLEGLQKLWLNGLLTYPGNWFKHIKRYYRGMWFQKPGWIFNSDQIQVAPSHPWHLSIVSQFNENERHITFTPVQKVIYDFFYAKRLLLSHEVGVKVGFAVLICCGLLWLLKPGLREPLLLFPISSSLSACFTAITIPLFSPYPDPRYMSPVLVLSLISLIGFAAWAHLQIISYCKKAQ